MTPQLKNILIFVAIGAVLLFVYFTFIKSDSEEGLVVTNPDGSVVGTDVGTGGVADTGPTSAITQEFLSILLNIQNLKLNDQILSDPAFISLQDSSIVLVPEGNEGRPNPFAPIGKDPAITTSTPTTTTPTQSGGPGI